MPQRKRPCRAVVDFDVFCEKSGSRHQPSGAVDSGCPPRGDASGRGAIGLSMSLLGYGIGPCLAERPGIGDDRQSRDAAGALTLC